jgi:preprotein translocase subunit SecD
MKNSYLFIYFLGLWLIACSAIPSLSGQMTSITLAPIDEPDDITVERLDQARETLQKRLDSLLEEQAQVTVDGKNLQLKLSDPNETPAALQLATEMGAVTFFGSMEPMNPGDAVPEVSEALLTDGDITQAGAILDQAAGWQVLITLRPEAGQRLADYTATNVGHYIIILRDGVVVSAPRITDAIPNNQAVIAGDFDETFAKTLAAELNSGRLPFDLEVIEQK